MLCNLTFSLVVVSCWQVDDSIQEDPTYCLHMYHCASGQSHLKHTLHPFIISCPSLIIIIVFTQHCILSLIFVIVTLQLRSPPDSPKKSFEQYIYIKWHRWYSQLAIKGNQKGKVTCYARERVNKNELFWMVITFLKSVVY